MKTIACPHCGNKGIITTKIPKDVGIWFPCPNCHGYVALFGNKIIAVNRAILRKGTLEERKAHLAEILAKFLEPMMFAQDGKETEDDHAPNLENAFGQPGEDTESSAAADSNLITDAEIQHFIKFMLQRLDDPAYFRKHFG